MSEKPWSWTYWTPQLVISTLLTYTTLTDEIASGMASPSDSVMGFGEWEPGSLIEKRVCRKADIDLAMDKLHPQVQKCIILYYVHGLESYRAVARALKISDHTVAGRVKKGVGAMAARLCNRRSAREEAQKLLPGIGKSQNRLRTGGPSSAPCVVDEGTLRLQRRERARRDET